MANRTRELLRLESISPARSISLAKSHSGVLEQVGVRGIIKASGLVHCSDSPSVISVATHSESLKLKGASDIFQSYRSGNTSIENLVNANPTRVATQLCLGDQKSIIGMLPLKKIVGCDNSVLAFCSTSSKLIFIDTTVLRALSQGRAGTEAKLAHASGNMGGSAGMTVNKLHTCIEEKNNWLRDIHLCFPQVREIYDCLYSEKKLTPEDILCEFFDNDSCDLPLSVVSRRLDFLISFVLHHQKVEPTRLIVADSRSISDGLSENYGNGLERYLGQVDPSFMSYQKLCHIHNLEGELPDGLFKESDLPLIND